MSYKYVTGLVVGKFCPMHNGHVMVIEKALEQCETVIVFSYTSMKFQGCEWYNREQWLNSINNGRLNVVVLDPTMTKFPDDDDPELDHRQFCAEYLLNTLDTTVQALFSSEKYGEPFAKYLASYFRAELGVPITVDHIMVDYDRKTHYVSGTYLRNNIRAGNYAYLHEYMHKVVRDSFTRKILFLGGESTGKSTLSKNLSVTFNMPLVEEFGRDLYDYRDHKLQYEDISLIARTQVFSENSIIASMNSHDFIFCDTSPLTTKFYAKEWFGRVPTELSEILYRNIRSYYKVYVCAPDFPLVQDGTRQDESFRTKAHLFYLSELTRLCIPFTILTGNMNNRLDLVISDLKSYSN